MEPVDDPPEAGAPMSRNRTPETQEKRRRERDRQAKQQAKLLARRARKAEKRAAAERGPEEGPEENSSAAAAPDMPQDGTAPMPTEKET